MVAALIGSATIVRWTSRLGVGRSAFMRCSLARRLVLASGRNSAQRDNERLTEAEVRVVEQAVRIGRGSTQRFAVCWRDVVLRCDTRLPAEGAG